MPLIQLISCKSFYCSKTPAWTFSQLCWNSPCWIKSKQLSPHDFELYSIIHQHFITCLHSGGNKMVTNPRYICNHAGVQVLAFTHCVEVVEEANVSWVRWFQGELEEGFHVQWRWDERWAPEEGRDRPRSVYTSYGRGTNRKINDLIIVNKKKKVWPFGMCDFCWKKMNENLMSMCKYEATATSWLA